MIVSESIKIGIYWKLKTDQKTNFKIPISIFFGSQVYRFNQDIADFSILLNCVYKIIFIAVQLEMHYYSIPKLK